MKLVLDVGNTNSKCAVFNGDKVKEAKHLSNSFLVEDIEALLNQYSDIEYGIISNVGHLQESILKALKVLLNWHELSFNSDLPFVNAYSTPKTLGVDRMALVSAAVHKYPKSNVLIIDAGTCITYDFKDADEVYYGGAISPGLRIRYEALHNFTAKLPLLEKQQPKDILGDSTESSIHSGVVLGCVNEIDGVIDTYRKRFSDLTVILTGGDSLFLSDQLKNSIFANSNFLLTGLNYLLDYNTKT